MSTKPKTDRSFSFSHQAIHTIPGILENKGNNGVRKQEITKKNSDGLKRRREKTRSGLIFCIKSHSIPFSLGCPSIFIHIFQPKEEEMSIRGAKMK
jgi:hypothetical protein